REIIEVSETHRFSPSDHTGETCQSRLWTGRWGKDPCRRRRRVAGVAKRGPRVVEHAPTLFVGQDVLPGRHCRIRETVAYPVEQLAVGMYPWRGVNAQVGRPWHQPQASRSVTMARLAV